MKNALILCFAWVVVACAGGGSSSTSPSGSGGSNSSSYTGTFTLKTANLADLPATVLSQSGYSLTVTSGTITVNTDFTYNMQVKLSQIKNGVTTTPQWTATGTYTAYTSYIFLHDPNDQFGQWSGTSTGVSGAGGVPTSVAVPPNGQQVQLSLAFGR